MLGGGVMGGGIAQVLAVAGYPVVVRDLNDEVVAKTRDAVVEGTWGIKRGVERGKVAFDAGVAAIGRLSFTTRMEDLAACDVVIEAIPEKLELKQPIFAELDRLVKPGAILASNTSGFPIQDVSRDVRPERRPLVIGMHLSNPVPTMRMCEVIYTPDTSQETIDTVVGLAEAGGKAVSLVRDTPGTYGFLLNRIFAAAKREADKIVADGIATKEDIDKAMITGRNWPAAFYGSRGGLGKQW